ncbi:MAG: hypothetical protein AAF639_02035 [Chloroflexota bacterium]
MITSYSRLVCVSLALSIVCQFSFIPFSATPFVSVAKAETIGDQGLPAILTMEGISELSLDTDLNGSVSTGDRIRYTAHITNMGDEHATSVNFICLFNERAQVIPESITTSQGLIHPDTQGFQIELGSVIQSDQATISFEVVVVEGESQGTPIDSLMTYMGISYDQDELVNDIGIGLDNQPPQHRLVISEDDINTPNPHMYYLPVILQ